MACNCGKSAKPMEYVFVAKDGTEKVYSTEIQARAAVIRNNGGKVVARVK